MAKSFVRHRMILLISNDCVRFSRRLWFFHFLVILKYRLSSDMEEKGIVAVCRLPVLPQQDT